MTPEERTQFNDMKMRLDALERVESVSFIENVKRRAVEGIRTDGETSAGTITSTVRNSAGTGTTDVAKVPDTKLKIVLSNGTVYYLGAYTS